MPGLSINVIEANKSSAAAAAEDFRKQSLTAHSTRSETEESFVENEEETDMNVDKPWVKPCLETAKTARKVYMYIARSYTSGVGPGKYYYTRLPQRRSGLFCKRGNCVRLGFGDVCTTAPVRLLTVSCTLSCASVVYVAWYTGDHPAVRK